MNNNGLSPLYIACDQNNLEVAKALLEKGADMAIESTNPPGWTALRIAETRGHDEVVALLRSPPKPRHHRASVPSQFIPEEASGDEGQAHGAPHRSCCVVS